MFNATIRHVEAAAVDARGRGQQVHELERDVDSRPKWYERLKNPDLRAGPLATSAGVLAEDYQGVAEEVIRRLEAAELPSTAAEVTA